jgi:hypothetical protein
VNAAGVLRVIEEAFPYVSRPAPADIPFHREDCSHCEYTVEELLKYPGPSLPPQAIRWLCDELTTMSAQATAYFLPSLLRYVMTDENGRDPRPTEFLIYGLGPSPEHAAETRARLSLLSTAQVEALLALVKHWAREGEWSKDWSEDLERASAFLEDLLPQSGRRTRR